jgi:hypothetical protein
MLLLATPGFSNYVLFPNTDVTDSVALNSNAYVGPAGGLLSMDTLTTLCEDPAQDGACSHFNTEGFVMTWPTNYSVQSYVSNATCGPNAKLSISSGTALSPPGTTYVVCTAAPGASVSAGYVLFATFKLPPFLIEEACDQNPNCVAFMVDSLGSEGWLLGFLPEKTEGPSGHARQLQFTSTATATSSSSATGTSSATATATGTCTSSSSATSSATATATSTFTAQTATATASAGTATATASASATASATASAAVCPGFGCSFVVRLPPQY